MAKSKATEWLEPDKLILIEGWARDGLTDAQIAHNIGIARSVLYSWKKKYEVFSNTLKKGKEVVDLQVENALLKRALGYTYDEIKIVESEKDGVRHETITKMVIPDVTAQIFWLKNRRPDKWRDKQIIENQGDGMLADLIDGLRNQGKDEEPPEK